MAANTDTTQILFPKKNPTFSSGKLTTKIIIKNDYVRADGSCALYLQMFLNGERKRLNLNIHVPEEAFDKIKMRVKKAYKGSRDLNLIIEKVLADVNQIEVMYRLSDTELTTDIIAKELKSPSSRLDFIKYFEEQINIDANHLNDATIRSARNVLAKIQEFRNIWLFRDLSRELMHDLFQFLKTHKKNSDNTIFNVSKYIRKYLKRAVKAGINCPIDYSDVPHKKVKADIGHLTKAEVKKLWEFYSAPYVPEVYRHVLAKFLFSCLTGLRISDIQALNQDSFVGDYLIKFEAKKTKKLQKIKLNFTAKKIIEDGYLFTGNYTDQAINRKLKEIAQLVGIPYRLHFHMARHSFATNFLKQGGRVEVLQRLLAHTSIRDTMNYVHVVDDDLNKEIFLLDNIFDDDDDENEILLQKDTVINIDYNFEDDE